MTNMKLLLVFGKFDPHLSLEEVQRRSAKVLQVAQSIYDFGYSGTENYIRAEVNLTQNGDIEINTIGGIEYAIQNYTTTANKELGSYKVSISNFPEGTKILSNANVETQRMSNSNFKIAIPIDNFIGNFEGLINITEAEVKTYPIFYADSRNSNTQNYVTYADPTEVGSATAVLNLDANKSSLKIVKTDENGKAVKDVVFNVKYTDGTVIGNHKTDDNGIIEINDLKLGSVIVKEISAPDEYVLDESEKTVKLKYNNTSTLNITNGTKKGYLQIVKKDTETQKIVKRAGTIFEIYNSDNEKVSSITTNSNGIATSGLLNYGTYYVKESKAPFKYTINLEESENIDIIEDGETYEISFSDVRTKGSVTISKEDNITGKNPQGDATLKGAVYGLYAKSPILDPADNEVIYEANEKIGELITDDNANATMSELYLGEYYIKEIKPSKGYNLDTTRYDFVLNYENQNVKVVTKSMEVKERVISQAFQIIKVSVNESVEAEKLKGAEFTIKLKSDVDKFGSWEDAPIAKNAKGKQAALLVTDEKGFAMSERIPYGTYIVRETKVPDEKERTEDFIVKITKDSNEPQVWRIFNDKEFTSVLALIKRDAETDKIVQVEGAKFKIKNVDTGEYWGYWDWNPLPHYVDAWTTDATGTVMTGEKLPIGNYQLEEQKSPKGYLISKTPVPFKISSHVAYEMLPDNNTSVITISQRDIPVKGKLNIEKRGEVLVDFRDGKFIYEERGLANAKYEVFAKEDIMDPCNDGTVIYKKGTVVDTITTNSEGKATSKELPLGEYSVREIQAPVGFVLSNEVKDVSLTYKDENTSIVYDDKTFLNDRQKFKLDLKKVLEEQKIFKSDIAYEDVKFGFYARDDIYNYKENLIVEKDTLIAVTGINKEGQLKDIPDLPIAKYYIKELETNEKYILDENTEYDFELSYHGQDIAEYTIKVGNGIIENKLARGTIQILKKDSFDENRKLENVEFNISSKSDMSEVIITEKTNNEGIATFKELELGTYYIQEAKQINGYALNDYIYEVKVTKNGDMLIVDCENKPTEMTFSKVDETGTQELPGATIQIIDKENGKVVEEWVSTEESHTIRYLIEGKEYIMKEVTAPYGYAIAEEIVFVAGDRQKIVMKDMPILCSVRVEKLDKATKEHIKSNKFVFGIYEDKECTKLIKQAGANEYEGTALFADLKFGTYYIKEIKAPLGYKLSNQVVKVEINEKGVFADGVSLEEKDNIYSFEYYNDLLPRIQTGNEMNYILLFSLLGISLLGITSGIIIIKRKNKESE